MDIKSIIKDDKEIIEGHLKKILDIKLSYSKIIIDSMSYSLFVGGKRLRPILFIETLKLFNIDFEKYLDIACVLEMIHTYSLIHDDLPAMDNDDLRRGKPTNHKVYGEDIAILAGDSLLNLSYEILFDFVYKNNTQNNILACRVISKNAGIYGMIGGQVSDVINENKDIDVENLEYIHYNKTAKLIVASILSAGYISNCNGEDISYLKNYAYNIGMAFQISDDILDIVGNSNTIGKTVGKDEQYGKNTYPKYFGLEDSKLKLRRHIENAKKEILKIDNERVKFFTELADFIGNRNF